MLQSYYCNNRTYLENYLAYTLNGTTIDPATTKGYIPYIPNYYNDGITEGGALCSFGLVGIRNKVFIAVFVVGALGNFLMI